ncbi:MAG: hypothetical protein P4K94_09380, partial [Terracidiphilus sp.]|nr:hypothetical protein [Terracidiphilus sp.]
NIRLINRRSNLPRLLLALSSINGKNNDKSKTNPEDVQRLTGALHIRAWEEAGRTGRIQADSRAFRSAKCA